MVERNTAFHDTETQVIDQGKRLLAAMHRRAKESRPGNPWMDRFLRKIMEDQRFRMQALRFVDVLPTLDSDRELARHLDEYFADHELPLTALIKFGIRYTRKSMATALVGRAVHNAMAAVSKRFMGGADVDQVMQTAKTLHGQGIDVSIDLLGEAIVSESEADLYRDRYLRLLKEIPTKFGSWEPEAGRELPQLNVSLKVTSLYSQITHLDPDASIAGIVSRLRPIFQAARDGGAFVCLDMEQYDFKDVTLECFRRLLMEPEFRDWPHAGIALQTYLLDTEQDIKELVDWARERRTPITVRLVRGAYWDYETVIARQNDWTEPVWPAKWQTDACYERCTRLLIDSHPHVKAAIATHNIRSIALAMVLTEEKGLDKGQFEFQMLYGMAMSLQDVLPEMGYRLRVYVPFGEILPGMAYLVRRLLENTSSQSFQRMAYAQHLAPSQLLATPHGPEGESEPSQPVAEDGASQTESGGVADQDPLRKFVNESPRRFTDKGERLSFLATIARVRDGLGETYPLAIGGEAIDTGDYIVSVNPACPDEVVGQVAKAGVEQADDAFESAAGAFPEWSACSMQERAQYLVVAAARLRERRDEFAVLEILEAGKTWGEADTNVTEAIDFLEYYAQQALRFGISSGICAPGETNVNMYRPRGVGVIIPPWNFPLAILTGMLSAAIVSGNTVVLKPSSQTPVIAARFVSLLQDIGLPTGVVQFLPGPGESLGDYLIRHPKVSFIAFTGSQEVGTHILRQAADTSPGQQHVKHVIAEMGGKNAVIVDSDADLDDAVLGIAYSAFGYQGQKCSACSRVIVVGESYDRFLARLIEATRSLKVGLPEEPSTVIGPVIEKAARDRILEAVRTGAKSAELVLEVQCANSEGYYVGPTIFSNVDPDSRLAQEEIFGPVLSVMRAADIDAAIALANRSAYALTGGLYSRSPANIAKARRKFQVGNLYINRKITGALVGRQPFGGFKLSGLGSKAGGPDYLRQFLVSVTITENTLRRGFAPSDEVADFDNW